jgi:hypothetical protein
VVEFTFPVRRDEANCPLADFRTVETTYRDSGQAIEPGDLDQRPPVGLRYMGSLTMTDLGAEACQVEPVLAALPFGVDLPNGTELSTVQVQVDYGQGWQTAECQMNQGQYLCWAQVPNPLIDRPLVATVQAMGETTVGFSLPFGGLCLIFD